MGVRSGAHLVGGLIWTLVAALQLGRPVADKACKLLTLFVDSINPEFITNSAVGTLEPLLQVGKGGQ